jgi:RNA polymerase sigma-70 factor (ECF subfamily)
VVAPSESAEDVAAEIWLGVVRRLADFRGDEAAWRGWLFTTARRRVIDEKRRRSRRPSVPVDATEERDWPSSPDAADAALENLSTATAIAVIRTLPPLQAEVIMLRVVGGLSNEQVARLVGRSPGAIRVAAHRGLKQLGAVLRAEGVTP